MFKRILVANRGEIACRIVRSIKELGCEAAVIYSEADRDSLALSMADYTIPIGGITAKESYLSIPKIINAINATQCDAIHPGYGFLSENRHFAEAIAKETKAAFIGPTVKAMTLMGDKISAKHLMRTHKIPIVPGSEGELASLQDLERTAKDIGFPLILKAAAGGGGRGMRIVRESSELAPAYAACRREAESYFGNPSVFCERYIANPRHIEFQVLFDTHGNGIHLFERDCSIQRRHQKLFEEAPSQYLDAEHRQKFGDIAVRAAKAANYVGAGTIEFICESPDKAYFMEMNTRIQVEHPVTEMITGIDLISAQIRVAAGEPLPWKQEEIPLRGWAMEARINAEDANAGFIPQVGAIKRLHLPAGPFTRIDTHIYPGFTISDAYDSMIAKLICWGNTREEARKRLLRALREFTIEGIKTSCDFHEKLLTHPQFMESHFSTNFLVEQEAALTKPNALAQPHWVPLVSSFFAQKASQEPLAAPRSSAGEWAKSALQEATRRMT